MILRENFSMSTEDFLNTEVGKSREMVLYHQFKKMGDEIFLYKLHFPEADPRKEQRFKLFFQPDIKIESDDEPICEDDYKNIIMAKKLHGRQSSNNRTPSRK